MSTVKSRWVGSAVLAVANLASPSFARAATEDVSVLTKYPYLQDYIYEEQRSGLHFGLGLSPLAIQNDRFGLTLNVFQIHWQKGPWDLELFSASVGATFAQGSAASSRSVLLRSIPKYKIFGGMSIGPLIGAEFIEFSSVKTKLFKANTATKDFEPFSASGLVYGFALSQSFQLKGDLQLKLNEIFYRETYDHLQTSQGWKYIFEDSSLDPSSLEAGSVLMLELSLIY